MRTRPAVLCALTLALCGAAVACGCSVVERAGTLVGVSRQAPAVPPAPQPAPRHLELRSGAADFDARVLARVGVEGARPAEALVEQAMRAAELLSADVGKPAEPWPVAADAASAPPAPAVEQHLIDYSAELVSARRQRAEWEDEVARAARQPATSGWRLSSPALGTWLLLGVGGVGAALVAVARRAWKWRKVALQLIPGIQQFLDAGGQGAAQLKAALGTATDKDVKVTIDAVKRDLGQ